MNLFGDLFIVLIFAFGLLLGISLLIWWVIRGLVLWYFRINEIVDLLEQIARNTRSGSKEAYTEAINKTVTHLSSSVTVPSKPASSSGRKCRDCGAELPRNAEFCPKCSVPVK